MDSQCEQIYPMRSQQKAVHLVSNYHRCRSALPNELAGLTGSCWHLLGSFAGAKWKALRWHRHRTECLHAGYDRVSAGGRSAPSAVTYGRVMLSHRSLRTQPDLFHAACITSCALRRLEHAHFQPSRFWRVPRILTGQQRNAPGLHRDNALEG